MNRIIIIGNGFDLAHNMATSYRNFLDDYWNNIINEIKGQPIPKVFENDELRISSVPANLQPTDYNNLIINIQGRNKIFYKNEFLDIISTKNFKNWVDIENEYYSILKKSYKEGNSNWNITKLNKDFKGIKKLLFDYLIKIQIEFDRTFDNRRLVRNIGGKIYSYFKLKDFTEQAVIKKTEIEYNKLKKSIEALKSGNIEMNDLDEKEKKIISNIDLKKPFESIKEILKSDFATNYFDLIPDHTLFLNFNYTYTDYLYENPNQFENNNNYSFRKYTKSEIIRIHGELRTKKNPIIFGFGDEIDNDYVEIENLNNNEYLENIKSIQYLETDNYKNLLNFLNSNNYQIFIFGHSCGISDRTLLNTLFENENCASIKLFYHQKDENSNNFSDIIRNISRNFNDKTIMRDKVVNKIFSEPLS